MPSVFGIMLFFKYYTFRYSSAVSKTIMRLNFAHFCLFDRRNCVLTTHVLIRTVLK
jgi:hypothetical protein